MIRLTIVAVAAVTLAGCGGEAETQPDASPPAPLAEALDGLCRALGLVGEGNVDEAARVFEDRAHVYIHELAAEGAEVAPEPTGRLLEAKDRAEAVFAHAPQTDPAVAQHLVDLDQAAREVARKLGLALPPPCRGAVA